MCPKFGTMGVYDSLHYSEASYPKIIDIIRKSDNSMQYIITIAYIGYSSNCITNRCLCILKVHIGYTGQWWAALSKEKKLVVRQAK
jgi:hypothetical protein